MSGCVRDSGQEAMELVSSDVNDEWRKPRGIFPPEGNALEGLPCPMPTGTIEAHKLQFVVWHLYRTESSWEVAGWVKQACSQTSRKG